MKSAKQNASTELYTQLRRLSWNQLWDQEVLRFNQASPRDRMSRVSVVRAVGVLAAESSSPKPRELAIPWLRRLLEDPEEKVRRYAIVALSKLNAGPEEETALVALLQRAVSPRERLAVEETLSKIGGTTTLESLTSNVLPAGIEQRVKATLARQEEPSSVRIDRRIPPLSEVQIHLRCRRGLEQILRGEVEDLIRNQGLVRVSEVHTGLVSLTPLVPITLAQLYTLRCFSTVGFALGTVANVDTPAGVDALVARITSPIAQNILHTLTQGKIRYRIEFVGEIQRKESVQRIADGIYARCPDLLNDPRQAPWTVVLYRTGSHCSIELTPRIAPDPRLGYRLGDVSAASHPPLAAALARVSGKSPGEIVWDPFCGSGMELVERAMLGGVVRVFGSDLDPEAIQIAQENFAAAKLPSNNATFGVADFRDFTKIPGLSVDSVSLIVTNPPMGRRVRIGSLHTLMREFFQVAATVLKPGGRLIFPNPLQWDNPHPALRLQYRQVVDMGGFDCRIEKYVKLPGQG